MASGANDTLRLASDFRRASRRDMISFSSSFLSFSSRSRAAACCSSSVRKVTRVSLTAGLPDTSKGFVSFSAPDTVAPGISTSKSIKFSVFWADGGVVFLGLLRVDLCAGISRSGGMVGLRIDLGGGCGIVARDCVGVSCVLFY